MFELNRKNSTKICCGTVRTTAFDRQHHFPPALESRRKILIEKKIALSSCDRSNSLIVNVNISFEFGAMARRTMQPKTLKDLVNTVLSAQQ